MLKNLKTSLQSLIHRMFRDAHIECYRPELLPKETVKIVTEQTTVPRSTTAPVMENTGYTATMKQSTATDFITPVQTTILTDAWEKTETKAISIGVVIILFAGIIIFVVYRKKRSAETSHINSEDTQKHLQTDNVEDNSPLPDTSGEESEEETFF
ncbi:hypothetical protein PRIEUP_LOCUS6536, partial [Pristimantis euphronides]